MKKAICLSFILFSLASYSQSRFLSTVKIEFEKTVYARQLMKAIEPQWYERVKDRVAETMLSYFDFIGDTTNSIYKPGKEVPYDPRSFFQGLADKNVVYNNYKTKTTVTQKPVFEETFLVQDSLTKIKWKLTADTRIIAGRPLDSLTTRLQCLRFIQTKYLSMVALKALTDFPG